MKTDDFRRLTAEVEKLTPHQRQVLADRLRTAGQGRAVREWVESRLASTPVCPRCGHEKVLRWGSAA